MKYRTKLLLNFTAVFVVFAVVLMVFQHHREVVYREQLMAARLRSYADIVAVQHRAGGDSALVATPEMRTTIITRTGQVVYESDSLALLSPSNHNSRPEVRQAWQTGESYDVRQSETVKRPYFYFAKNYGNFQVRVALPYDDDVRDYMRPENIFTIFVLLLFPVVIVLLLYLSDRFGKAIAGLRQFIESANRGLIDYDHIHFPKTELGDIGSAILEKYRQLEDSNKIIAMERERLALHFLYFEGGIAIFSPERRKLLANATFLQYVNTILEAPTPNLDHIWETETFRPVIDFLNTRTPSTQIDLGAVGSVFRYTIQAGSANFAVQVLVYGEGSFEVTLTDVTQAEKTRTLKQQMSNNITHELRTPVSSIRGYLETLLSGPTLSPDRQRVFLERTYAQAVRLSDLIRDVALISKAEEAPDTLPRDLV
ncbi:MAG: histidine kinase dimerization/phospho-acceptor domain-containing protein, partial [Alloprevotella sp.]|nr:histidine kinase dimerization/phospho-acceptor domain-containing protein [Alloprevotella sp.]